MLPSQCHINLTSSQIHITRTADLLLHCNIGGYPGAMSTLPKTLTLDTSTSRANPTPQPMKRLTVPRLRQRKSGEPTVMLTAYTVRPPTLPYSHCYMLLFVDTPPPVIHTLPHHAQPH